MKQETIYTPLLKQARKMVNAYSKAAGITQTEAARLIVPVMVQQYRATLEDEFKLEHLD